MAKSKTWTFTVRAPVALKAQVKGLLRPEEGLRLNQFTIRALKNEIAKGQ